MKKTSCLIFFMVLTALSWAPLAPAQDRVLTVGSDRSPDRIIMARLFMGLLEDRGFSCKDMTGLGSFSLVRNGLLNRQIDLYPAYTGDLLDEVPDKKISGDDPQALFRAARNRELTAKGLVWLDMIVARKTPRIWLKRRLARTRKLKTITDLASYIKARKEKPYLGLTPKFLIADNGYRPLAQAYGLEFPGDRIIKMDRLFLYPALEEEGVDVVIGNSLDWEPIRSKLAYLKDDLGFFRPSNPSAVVRLETTGKYVELGAIIAELSPLLTSAEMAKLIGLVHDGSDQTLVAAQWLREKKLIRK